MSFCGCWSFGITTTVNQWKTPHKINTLIEHIKLKDLLLVFFGSSYTDCMSMFFFFVTKLILFHIAILPLFNSTEVLLGFKFHVFLVQESCLFKIPIHIHLLNCHVLFSTKLCSSFSFPNSKFFFFVDLELLHFFIGDDFSCQFWELLGNCLLLGHLSGILGFWDHIWVWGCILCGVEWLWCAFGWKSRIVYTNCGVSRGNVTENILRFRAVQKKQGKVFSEILVGLKQTMQFILSWRVGKKRVVLEDIVQVSRVKASFNNHSRQNIWNLFLGFNYKRAVKLSIHLPNTNRERLSFYQLYGFSFQIGYFILILPFCCFFLL
ncbi:hypothetical protein VP01_1786g2 [Puccinia sorghi]|uniref:Uncharacterized protein n=1 Tax=Puccinia sorghi TaxID=27349 RepID=A0A0L6VF41_9BASI|nr:hypothetical protein VP01_1786g2 [Puccinia sorghi]